ncbi:hypothetical protein L903_21445 [Agrobacterium sp. JL28]|nr:hypothetical protein L904_21425 [Agrobacterium sp. LY4]KVK48767.1 hypothetical protein L903_21445 [Agrobacterium sp. JL28]
MGADGSFMPIFLSALTVMPDLIRHPASPSPWAEKVFFTAWTRGGRIPAQGRNDGKVQCTERAPFPIV